MIKNNGEYMAKRKKILVSAVIISFNEENCIERAVKSVKWADEVLVVDSGSTDSTVSLARSLGASVIHNKWPGFAAQKNFAIKKASGVWVLSIDADEEVSAELASNIRKAALSGENADGYWICRKNYYYGSRDYMKHGTVFPDASIRLIKKGRGAYNAALVHEQIVVKGPTLRLAGFISHYSKPLVSEHLSAINKYTTLEAMDSFKKGRRASGYSILIKPGYFFIKKYFFKAGFLDGFQGFLYQFLSAFYVFMHEIKLLELEKKSCVDYNPLKTMFVRYKNME
jgi:glycosyltransferase involved in cell wall biosynthesis